MMQIQEPKNIKNYAHIVNGKVVNVSLWDGQSPWTYSKDVVEIPSVDYLDEETGETKQRAIAGIGWDYLNGEFIDNRPVVNPFPNDLDVSSQPNEEEI